MGLVPIFDIEKGSIKLILEGSQEGLERLERLFKSGELTEILDIPVEDVSFVDAGTSKDDKKRLAFTIDGNATQADIENLKAAFTEASNQENTEIDNNPHLVQEIRRKGAKGRNLSGVDLIDVDLSDANLENTIGMKTQPLHSLFAKSSIKRCIDIICTSVLLVLLLPVYLAIALSIKLDSPGPIFFKQERIGLHGQKFKIWRFRTMVTNAEKLKASLANEINDGVLFKLKDDPRITSVGKFLRRSSLDELPQLFNVLLGQMSLVGPPPLPSRGVIKFTEKDFIRLEVLPGITGLWQVSDSSNIIEKFEEMVKFDIDYVENWSLWLDMQILLKTLYMVLRGRSLMAME